MNVSREKLVGALLVAAVLFASGSSWLRGRALGNAREELRTAALVRDSLEAAADTTRRLLLGQVAAADRRAIQAEAQRDSLDRRLRRETRMKADLLVRIQRLAAELESSEVVEVVDDSVRVATFALDSTPYHVTAAVRLPPPPARGDAKISVVLDPIRILPRASCGEPHPETGIRPAYVTVETPPWLTTAIADPVMDPRLCNPPPPPAPSFFRRVWQAKAEIGVAAALGFVVGVVAGR